MEWASKALAEPPVRKTTLDVPLSDNLCESFSLPPQVLRTLRMTGLHMPVIA